jgi:hypothetical protein
MATGNYDYDTSENSLAIDVDMAIDVDSTVKSNPKELDEDSQGANSLSNLIASARRKALFKSAPGTQDKQTITTTQSRKWVPIGKTREV